MISTGNHMGTLFQEMDWLFFKTLSVCSSKVLLTSDEVIVVENIILGILFLRFFITLFFFLLRLYFTGVVGLLDRGHHISFWQCIKVINLVE
jgi:hypothetical protein